MAAQEGRPPGWHPDPEDPASLRHWDGRRWGQERRPRPRWARAPARSGPVAPRRRPGRWWLVAAGATAVAVAVALGLSRLVAGPDIPPRSVGDRGFTEEANRVCRRELPPIRRDRPPLRDRSRRSTAEVARQVERTAQRLGAFVAQLRALPVSPADRTEIGRWLDDWERYVEVGRRYADALRAGDEGRFTAIAADGEPLTRRLFVFARSNDMPACVP